jgi:hippurate hydrolase
LVFGPERVTRNGAALTASEDFAFMLERVPGCYFLVGNGGPGSAAAFWTQLVQTFLQTGSLPPQP